MNYLHRSNNVPVKTGCKINLEGAPLTDPCMKHIYNFYTGIPAICTYSLTRSMRRMVTVQACSQPLGVGPEDPHRQSLVPRG